MQPIKLSADERSILARCLEEHFSEYAKAPGTKMELFADRVADDMTSILEARETKPSWGRRLKPDDKGDNPDGTVNMTVSDMDIPASPVIKKKPTIMKKEA